MVSHGSSAASSRIDRFAGPRLELRGVSRGAVETSLSRRLEAKTRLELLQQRKQRNLEELREAEAQSAYVPPEALMVYIASGGSEVRHTRAELEEHEAGLLSRRLSDEVRRPDPHAMTQNKLLDLRKREYMELGPHCGAFCRGNLEVDVPGACFS